MSNLRGERAAELRPGSPIPGADKLGELKMEQLKIFQRVACGKARGKTLLNKKSMFERGWTLSTCGHESHYGIDCKGLRSFRSYFSGDTMGGCSLSSNDILVFDSSRKQSRETSFHESQMASGCSVRLQKTSYMSNLDGDLIEKRMYRFHEEMESDSDSGSLVSEDTDSEGDDMSFPH